MIESSLHITREWNINIRIQDPCTSRSILINTPIVETSLMRITAIYQAKKRYEYNAKFQDNLVAAYNGIIHSRCGSTINEDELQWMK